MAADDVAAELEALQFTYPDQAIVSGQDKVLFKAQPYTAEDATRVFVQALLQIDLPSGYPTTPAHLGLAEAKGLGDSRQAALLSKLAQEAKSLAGELMLGHLCETANEFLTSVNYPEGSCIFCLCSMEVSNQQEQQLLKLSCYHTFHRNCFLAWWGWQQSSLAREEQQLLQSQSQAAAEQLIKERLPAKLDGTFQLACPVCRFALSGEESSDIKALAESSSGVADQWHDSVCSCSLGTVLGGPELAAHRHKQKHWQHLFAAQQAKGGIIEEVNYSISGLAARPQPPVAAANAHRNKVSCSNAVTHAANGNPNLQPPRYQKHAGADAAQGPKPRGNR